VVVVGVVKNHECDNISKGNTVAPYNGSDKSILLLLLLLLLPPPPPLLLPPGSFKTPPSLPLGDNSLKFCFASQRYLEGHSHQHTLPPPLVEQIKDHVGR